MAVNGNSSNNSVGTSAMVFFMVINFVNLFAVIHPLGVLGLHMKLCDVCAYWRLNCWRCQG